MEDRLDDGMDHTGATAPQLSQDTAGKESQRQMERQSQRLEDLIGEALEDPDSLRASVKVAIAQLLEIGYRMGEAVKANLGRGIGKGRASHDSTAGVSTLMLVHRQITRYVQLDQQWSRQQNTK